MRQEDTMVRCTLVPLVIKPRVYELTLNFWNWCKLTEVCELVPGLAQIAEVDFNPTPEELISRFAALVRPNRIPDHVPQEKREERKKKIFRYSMDGMGLSGARVPTDGMNAPPYAPFQLPIETPYPETMFVPEGWAIDTLYAIRRGAVAAAEWDGTQVGFPPRTSNGPAIHLGGKDGLFLARMPACV
jgi:hypothetical protein